VEKVEMCRPLSRDERAVVRDVVKVVLGVGRWDCRVRAEVKSWWRSCW
jgi:hypothetical protein